MKSETHKRQYDKMMRTKETCTMKYTLNDLQDEDIPSLAEIYNYYIRNTCYTFEEKELSLEEFTIRCHTIHAKYPYIVIKNEEGKVLGYSYLDTFASRSAYRYSVDLSIYISKDHTHEGLGKILLSEIEKKAREQGYRNIISIVTSENQASMKFHERNGFVLQGHLTNIGYKMNRWLGTYYYQKELREQK